MTGASPVVVVGHEGQSCVENLLMKRMNCEEDGSFEDEISLEDFHFSRSVDDAQRAEDLDHSGSGSLALQQGAPREHDLDDTDSPKDVACEDPPPRPRDKSGLCFFLAVICSSLAFSILFLAVCGGCSSYIYREKAVDVRENVSFPSTYWLQNIQESSFLKVSTSDHMPVSFLAAEPTFRPIGTARRLSCTDRVIRWEISFNPFNPTFTDRLEDLSVSVDEMSYRYDYDEPGRGPEPESKSYVFEKKEIPESRRRAINAMDAFYRKSRVRVLDLIRFGTEKTVADVLRDMVSHELNKKGGRQLFTWVFYGYKTSDGRNRMAFVFAKKVVFARSDWFSKHFSLPNHIDSVIFAAGEAKIVESYEKPPPERHLHITLNNLSGTYKPTLDDLEGSARLLQEVLRGSVDPQSQSLSISVDAISPFADDEAFGKFLDHFWGRQVGPYSPSELEERQRVIQNRAFLGDLLSFIKPDPESLSMISEYFGLGDLAVASEIGIAADHQHADSSLPAGEAPSGRLGSSALFCSEDDF